MTERTPTPAVFTGQSLVELSLRRGGTHPLLFATATVDLEPIPLAHQRRVMKELIEDMTMSFLDRHWPE